FLQQIKEKKYVNFDGAGSAVPASSEERDEPSAEKANGPATERSRIAPPSQPPVSASPPHRSPLAEAIIDDERRKKVFITHGKSRDLVEPVKKLLEFGELLPIVSVERQSVSKPVPEKVMDDMRSCGAAIIHVDADRTIKDEGGEDHV